MVVCPASQLRFRAFYSANQGHQKGLDNQHHALALMRHTLGLRAIRFPAIAVCLLYLAESSSYIDRTIVYHTHPSCAYPR